MKDKEALDIVGKIRAGKEFNIADISTCQVVSYEGTSTSIMYELLSSKNLTILNSLWKANSEMFRASAHCITVDLNKTALELLIAKLLEVFAPDGIEGYRSVLCLLVEAGIDFARIKSQLQTEKHSTTDNIRENAEALQAIIESCETEHTSALLGLSGPELPYTI